MQAEATGYQSCTTTRLWALHKALGRGNYSTANGVCALRVSQSNTREERVMQGGSTIDG